MILPPLTNPSGLLEWARRVREAINGATNGYPFPMLDADPPSAELKPGFTYYNLVSNTTRQWNGTVWGAL